MKKSAKSELKWGLIIALILLVNLSTLTTGGSVSISDFIIHNFFAISLFCYIYLIAEIAIFLVSSFRSLRFHYKFKISSQYQKVQVAATISASLGIFFTILIGILIFVYNQMLLAFIGIFLPIFIIICVIIPNSLRKPAVDKESCIPWIEDKERRR